MAKRLEKAFRSVFAVFFGNRRKQGFVERVYKHSQRKTVLKYSAAVKFSVYPPIAKEDRVVAREWVGAVSNRACPTARHYTAKHSIHRKVLKCPMYEKLRLEHNTREMELTSRQIWFLPTDSYQGEKIEVLAKQLIGVLLTADSLYGQLQRLQEWEVLSGSGMTGRKARLQLVCTSVVSQIRSMLDLAMTLQLILKGLSPMLRMLLEQQKELPDWVFDAFLRRD